MPDAAQIAQRIRDALSLSERDLDTTVGSVAGKIIDAVSVPVAEAFTDQQLSRYQYDIDSMTAGALEGFVRLFGIDRHPARYAVGTVTIGRNASTATKGVAVIPAGTQIMSNTSPVVFVQTTGSAIMSVGQTSVDVPVQAVAPGSAGNVAAGTLTTIASDVAGISTATNNLTAMGYGRDAESDDDLRERWKRTVFRNMAGTRQMYRAMALQAAEAVSAVNVLGSKKTWTDRITITSGTSGPISFGNPEFIYNSGVFVGPDLGGADLLARALDYSVTINNSVSPATISIDALSGGTLNDGDYDIQFDYVPTWSRNNPFGTRFNETSPVNNRIDLWANGQEPVSVTHSGKFVSAARMRFTSTPTDIFYRNNYRTLRGALPSVNDIFTPLAFGPILSVPDTLTIGGSTFNEGTHYDVVHRADAFGYTASSPCGLVWYASGSLPTAGTTFAITYIYNQVPALIQQAIQSQWRLLGTDCQVHAAIVQQYRFHLAVIYERGFDTASVNTAINVAIAKLIGDLGFDSAMQISDLLQVVHNVSGVDNVRFLNSTDDGTHYAVEKMSFDGVPSGVISSSGRAIDVYFDDAHVPALYSVRILTKTRTNFGVV